MYFLGLGHTARKHVLRHVLNIALAMFGFMFDMSRLDVQTPKHVWRRCYVDVSWPETSVRTTTRVNISYVLLLIDVYHGNPIQWDPTNPNYKDKNKKCYTWKAIGAELNVDRIEVMKKNRHTNKAMSTVTASCVFVWTVKMF